MKERGFKSGLGLSIISIASLAASTDVYAQLESQGPLLFDGIATPWQTILMIGIGVGILLSLAPFVTDMLDAAARMTALRDKRQTDRPSGRFMPFLACLTGAVLAAALISGNLGGVDIGRLLANETWMPIVLGAILILSALSLFGLYQIRIPNALLADDRPGPSPPVAYRFLLLCGFGFLPVLVLVAIVAPLFLPVSVMADSSLFFAAVVVFALMWSVLLITAPQRMKQILTLIERRDSDRKLPARRLLGILQVAAVIHLLGEIPDVPVLLLWGLLLVLTAVYLGAGQMSASTPSSSDRLLKGAGIAVMVWGGVVLVGASAGNRDITDPLPQLSRIIAGGGLTDVNDAGNAGSKLFTYVTGADEFDQLLNDAKAIGRPVMLDFFADWCLDCKRMDRSTFRDPTVVARLQEDFLALKLDVTDPDDEFGRSTRKRLGVFGPPALVFFDEQGNYLDGLLSYGFLDTEELLQLLSEVSS